MSWAVRGKYPEMIKYCQPFPTKLPRVKKKNAYAASSAGRPLGPTPFENSCRNSIENNSICHAKPPNVGHRVSSVITRYQDKMQKLYVIGNFNRAITNAEIKCTDVFVSYPGGSVSDTLVFFRNSEIKILWKIENCIYTYDELLSWNLCIYTDEEMDICKTPMLTERANLTRVSSVDRCRTDSKLNRCTTRQLYNAQCTAGTFILYEVRQ